MPLDDAAPRGTGTAWRVELLGGLRAVPCAPPENGPARQPVEQFRTHKAALLLVRLSLSQDRAHGREELADLLWPDAPADRGRASLTQTLVYLRQALGEPRIGGLFIADHQTIRVAKGRLRTDVADWEAAAARALAAASDPEQATLLRSALAAYRGDLLPGVYDDWVERERTRLTALHDTLQARLQALPAPQQPRRPVPMILNEPLFLTRFFGRASETAGAARLLCDESPARLLTLLGMGGIGKTRLALQIARSVLGGPFGGAAFVPLAEARTAAQMESALLQALGIAGGSADGLRAVVSHLNDWAARTTGLLLLVLDNLEQMEEAAAPVIALLLTGVSALTILATSRQPVGVYGEQEMPVGPLPGVADAPGVAVPDAVGLFVDRARLVRPDFRLTAENRPVVARLCTLLEGVPLALELAAAWSRVLTPIQIAARLNHRFDLLSLHGTAAARGGTIPKRHQSLHAAVAWSYDLLGPSLQTFWSQLSVFRGGWTAAAARAVTGITEVSEPLLLLTERSLLLADADEKTGEVRFRMLESLREFAEEQARTMGQAASSALCDRRARYFAHLSGEANRMVEDGRGMRPALALLGPERDNLRAVFAWLRDEGAAGSGSGVEAAIRCMLQSHWLWPVNELRQYLCLAAEALPLVPYEGGSNSLRAGVISLQGLYAFHAGDYPAAERYLQGALTLLDANGSDRKAFFTARSRLAMLRNRTGDPDAAIALWRECLQFARESEDPRREAALLTNLANAGRDLSESRAYLERAVTLYRIHAPGSFVLACSLNSTGAIALEQRDWETARVCLEEAHALALAEGALGMVGLVKASLAELFTETGEHLDRAHDLLVEAQAIFEEKQERLRVAQICLLRFHLALRIGDADDAVALARSYLRVNGEAGLMDAAALAAARADMVRRLQAAGYGKHAARLADSLG